MKRRPFVLVAFLLVLCVSPVFLISSYSYSTTHTQLNTSKDYALSDITPTFEVHEDSVNSFWETLDDNVLYFPDSVTLDTVTAIYGGGSASNNDWADTLVLDTFCWSIFEGLGSEYIAFDAPFGTIQGFEYAIYANAIGGSAEANLTTPDSMSNFLLTITQNANLTWYNGSYKGNVYDETRMYLSVADTAITSGDAVTIDYIEITFHVMTLDDLYDHHPTPEHYGEGFWNVSDWIGVNDPIVTDGDIATLTTSAGNVWDRYDCNVPDGSSDWFNSYVEVRVKANVSTSRLYVYTKTGDDYTGDVAHSEVMTTNCPTEWTTFKFIHSESEGKTVECISLLFRGLYNTEVEIDYLRIGQADEFGFQHDGSITHGLGVVNGSSVSSNGYQLTVLNDAESQLDFHIDVNTTASHNSSIDTTYYPFVEIRFHPDSIGMDFALSGWTGSSYESIQSLTTISEYMYRYNLVSVLSGDIEHFRFYFYDSDTIKIDHIKCYSIADFTVGSISDEAVTDVAYTEDGVLFVSSVTNDVIQFYNDRLLSIVADADNDDYWHATILDGSENFRFYISSFWDQGVISAALPDGTTTDFLFSSYGQLNISSIEFYIRIPVWHDVTEVDLIFYLSDWRIITSVLLIFVTELNTFTLNALLIFSGLVMIPASTVYLAYGGKNNMSTDKLLYGLLAFVVGWGLVIGGILA